ncbi:MAG: AAA family ATPase [Candidatus Micrarchaeaceae archaeon]
MGVLVLFDLNPKENVLDLYNRKRELDSLSSSLKNGERLIIIYGLRRVGKTSLIHSFLNKREFPYILLDMKEIYYASGSIPMKALYNSIVKEFVKFTEKVGEDADIGLDGNFKLTDLLKGINEWCMARKLVFIIAFDEAQYLRFGGRVRYDGIIAWSIDNLSNIIFVLTGSEAGMLKEFLRYEDTEAPLYGRFRNEIYLNRFTKEEGIGFLKRGFKEAGKHIRSHELDDVIKNLDGISGWLTYYGYYRTKKGMAHEKAVAQVFNEGSQLTLKEIETFISRSRKRYIYILKAIVEGLDTWGAIKAYVGSNAGEISDTVLNSLLQMLVKLGIAEKLGSAKYVISDPMVIEAIKRLRA